MKRLISIVRKEFLPEEANLKYFERLITFYLNLSSLGKAILTKFLFSYGVVYDYYFVFFRIEDILLHEFSHGVHLVGVMPADPTFDRRLKAQYNAARSAGLWRGTYALTNDHEYWVGTLSIQPPLFLHISLFFQIEFHSKAIHFQ